MPGNTAPSLQYSQSGNRTSHAAPRVFRCGRSVERLISGAEFMRDIAKILILEPGTLMRDRPDICAALPVYGENSSLRKGGVHISTFEGT